MRRVDITGIALEAHSGAPLVVLREQDEPHRLLPIFIGAPEASAIAIAATGQQPPRPMVHDVMAALVMSLDGRVEAIEVTGLQDGTYFASINVAGPGGTRQVDSRPSDALALAVRVGAPVWVHESVLDEAGSLPEPEDPADTESVVDDATIEAELDDFRSFLDDVDPADFIALDGVDTDTPVTDSGEIDNTGAADSGVTDAGADTPPDSSGAERPDPGEPAAD